MKRVARRADALSDITLSPVTKSGEIVYSSITQESDPFNPTDLWIVEYTPDAEDAIKVLKFLNEMNGIGWTPRLKKAEKELRLALLDLMSVKE